MDEHQLRQVFHLHHLPRGEDNTITDEQATGLGRSGILGRPFLANGGFSRHWNLLISEGHEMENLPICLQQAIEDGAGVLPDG